MIKTTLRNESPWGKPQGIPDVIPRAPSPPCHPRRKQRGIGEGNKKILRFTIGQDQTCSLLLSQEYTITTECMVRFQGKKREFICAQDHGGQFGLEFPYDAEQAINFLIEGQSIIKVEWNRNSGDLHLFCQSGVLQIICHSAGYECYQISGPENFILIVRGGDQG